MSKIDELIQELCPNGIVFKELGTFCKLLRGKRLTKKELFDDGDYPVFHGGLIPLGHYDKFNRRADQTMVINTGSVGEVVWSDVDFWSSDGTFVVETTDSIDDKYLYYFLKTQESYLKTQKREGGVPTIERAAVEKLRVPVPPFEVQKEIVDILDKFTQLEAGLSAGLSAELDARRKQYEYYRDYLFSDSGPKMQKKPLATLAKKIYSGGTPKTGNAEYWDNGTIPWMSSGEVNLGTVYATEKFITETGLKNSSAKWVPKNSVVIALAGQGKTRGTVARTRIELTTNQSLASLVLDEKVINPDYVFHFLRSQYQELRRISSGDGTRGGLNLKMIGNFDIPVRPLSEQDRIVSILDRFEVLINDMSVGLPAEINARRQQYEYYRTKLLTFQELSA